MKNKLMWVLCAGCSAGAPPTDVSEAHFAAEMEDLAAMASGFAQAAAGAAAAFDGVGDCTWTPEVAPDGLGGQAAVALEAAPCGVELPTEPPVAYTLSAGAYAFTWQLRPGGITVDGGGERSASLTRSLADGEVWPASQELRSLTVEASPDGEVEAWSASATWTTLRGGQWSLDADFEGGEGEVTLTHADGGSCEVAGAPGAFTVSCGGRAGVAAAR
jgi:hypothetical protein